MTKEELKQEAEKSLDKRLGTYAYIRKQDCYTNYVDGYIDSAEPREKRIAELERKLEQTEKDLADYQFNYPTIKELEKENAELLEKLKNQKADYETYYKSCYNAQKKTEKQLTNAKELLKRCYDNYIYLQPLRGDIEQFLNSEVEK
jgi:DNA repair exonuclease SbcCD ATPase subunit